MNTVLSFLVTMPIAVLAICAVAYVPLCAIALYDISALRKFAKWVKILWATSLLILAIPIYMPLAIVFPVGFRIPAALFVFTTLFIAILYTSKRYYKYSKWAKKINKEVLSIIVTVLIASLLLLL